MAGIEQLKSKVSIKNGLAMGHQYAVELPKWSGADGETMNLLCKSVDMPGKQIMTVDRQIGAHLEKIPNGYAVADVNMTFYMTNDYGPKKYFDTWMSKMIDEDDGSLKWKRGTSGTGGFVRDITIHQMVKPQARVGFDVGILDVNFDILGNSIYSVKLIDAFPTTVTPITLGNDGNIVELSVTFAYTKWEVKKDIRDKLSDFIDAKIGINLGGII